jgi:hypothetical protein
VSYPGPGGAATPGQVCCVCLYVREGVAEDAVTTIAGYSICEDHLGTITAGLGRDWASILTIAGRRASEPLPWRPTASPRPPAGE